MVACYLYLPKLNGWMSVFNMQLYTVSQFPHLLKPVELIDGSSLELSTEYEMSHFNSFKSPPVVNVVSQNITSSFLPVFLFCLIIWIIFCKLDCFKAAHSVNVLSLLCCATEEMTVIFFQYYTSLWSVMSKELQASRICIFNFFKYPPPPRNKKLSVWIQFHDYQWFYDWLVKCYEVKRFIIIHYPLALILIKYTWTD